MGAHPDHDVEVAAGAAADAGPALAGDAYARAVADSGRNLDLQPLEAEGGAGALADVTDGARDLAAAAAGAAGLLRLQLQEAGGAGERLLQGHLGGVLDVLAAHRAATAEERLEDSVEG